MAVNDVLCYERNVPVTLWALACSLLAALFIKFQLKDDVLDLLQAYRLLTSSRET